MGDVVIVDLLTTMFVLVLVTGGGIVVVLFLLTAWFLFMERCEESRSGDAATSRPENSRPVGPERLSSQRDRGAA